MVAVFSAAELDMDPNDAVVLNHRLDSSLFILRRPQAMTKVSQESIFELQCADDKAVVGNTTAVLQRNTAALEKTYQSRLENEHL